MGMAEIAWWVVIGVGLLYEMYAISNKKVGDTLSEAYWRIAYKRPFVPFMTGLLMGHFVWQGDCVRLEVSAILQLLGLA